MSLDISFSDYLAITNTAFEWAQSYDLKQWSRLHAILAPSIRLDFRPVGGPLTESMTPSEFVSFLSSDKIIGDPRLKTQHFLGGSSWERLTDDSIHVRYQTRVAHQRYKDESLKEVVNKGHGHGVTQLWYKRIDGMWKINGCTADLDWAEYDLFGTLDPDKAKAKGAEGSETM